MTTNAPDFPGPPTERAVPYRNFLAAAWATAGLAVIFVGIRIYSRFKGPGRLFADDFMIIFALLTLLLTACLWQWGARDFYVGLNVQPEYGVVPTLPDDWQPRLRRAINVWAINHFMMYTCLTAVKLSVLLFFRRLGHRQMKRVQMVWWPTVAVVVAAWIIMMGISPWRCFTASTDDLIKFAMVCHDPLYQRSLVTIAYKVNCALDVFSDFLITLLPVLIIWDVQIRLAKKLGFVGLFSLTIIVMVVAIVRIVGAARGPTGELDPTFLFLWSGIEMCIAIIIACLSSFPQLFLASRRKQLEGYHPSQTWVERIKARTSPGKSSNDSNMIDNELTSIAVHVRNHDFDYIAVPESTKSKSSIVHTSDDQVDNHQVTPQGIRPFPNREVSWTRAEEYHLRGYDNKQRA